MRKIEFHGGLAGLNEMLSASEIYYDDLPGGENIRPAVVLMHGAGGSGQSWPQELQSFSGHRTIALDLPGHGRSGGDGEQSIAAYAEIVSRWALQAGIAEAVYVGHSMGAAIALQLALDHQRLVRGMVLIGSGARLRVAPQILAGLAQDASHQQTVKNIVDLHFRHHTQKEFPEKLYRELIACRRSVIYGDFLACDTFDIRARLGEIRQTALVMCGEEDQLTPPKNSQYLAEHIPNARVMFMARCGHMLPWEMPTQAASSIQIFLAAIK